MSPRDGLHEESGVTAGPNPSPWSAELMGFVALLLLALASLSSKIAGTLWALGFIAGAVLAWRRRPWPQPDAIDRAALLGLMCVSYALVCWLALAVMRGELIPHLSAEPNSGLRLVLGALAGLWLVRVAFRKPARLDQGITSAVALAMLIAALLSIVTPRERLPSNAIAWASSMGFLACVLIGAALDRQAAAWQRRLAGAGCFAALIAIGGSQVRGAYPVALWLLGVVVWDAYRKHNRPLRMLVFGALGACAFAGCLAVLWMHPADPLRMREISTGLDRMRTEGDFNSQTGSRLYLFRLGWQTFTESPWIGVGAHERLRRIHSAGLDETPQHARATVLVREVGHVHNAFLHHAMDGGLLALSGFMATLVGLVWAGRIMGAVSPPAALQFYGLAFVHGCTNLTNVNFAHNYYALMYTISVVLVLVCARVRATRATPQRSDIRVVREASS